MGKKITYLLGAGASYQACPILSELGEKMIAMSKSYLRSEYKADYNIKRDTSRHSSENLMQLVGYFGRKASEFGTIDTYAKKLSLNNDYITELQYLKLTVSVFFTLWEMTDNKDLKRRKNDAIGIQFRSVDQRFVSLLATFLEKTDSGMPLLNDRVKFVTWNYDLQLEKTFMSFVAENRQLDWQYLNDYFKFRPKFDVNNTSLDVCHLNGYAGYYFVNKENEEIKEIAFLDRTESDELEEIVDQINFMYESISHGDIKIDDHINYAWEQNELAIQKREYAKKVFKESDVIVIIGYSFPPFNRKVDQMMFDELKGRKTKVYYQDPNASESLIKNYVDDDCDVEIFNDRPDQFLVPYEF